MVEEDNMKKVSGEEETAGEPSEKPEEGASVKKGKTTTKPARKKASPKKKEAPKEEKKEAPKEEKKEAPKEEKKEAPKEEKKEAPKEEKKEAPKEEKKEAPKEEKKEAPKEEKKEAPKEEKKEAPKEEKKEAPKEEKKEAPKEEKKEAPKEEKKEAPKEEEPRLEELIFGKYNTSNVVVEDPSLSAYINLEPAYVPHSSARHANKQFHKTRISIVERLVNSMMRTGKYTGKKTKSYNAVLEAFEIIQSRTKTNPVQVLVQALENSAPREEVTRLKFGGISVPKAVDTAPSRRLDIALRNISIGSVRSSHKNKKSIAQCLAGELISASKGDPQSYAVSKRDEMERVAKSAH